MAAELIFAPSVDRNKLKRTEIQISESIKNAGKRGSLGLQRQVMDATSRGASDGLDDGFRDAAPGLRNLGRTIAAIAVGAVVTDTLQKTFGSLEENLDRIQSKLEGIMEITSNAAAFEIDPARYAAISVASQAVGLDQSDLSGIIAGFRAALDDPELVKFREIAKNKGFESAFFNFLSASGQLTGSERSSQLIKAFGEDDFRLVSRLIEPINQLRSQGQEGNLQNLFRQITGQNLDLGAIAGGLNRTAESQRIVAQDQSRALLDQIISGVSGGQAGAVTALAQSQREVQATRMETLDLQVKAKIIADQMEINQIRAGSLASESVFQYGEDLMEFVENPSVETYLPTIPLYRSIQSGTLNLNPDDETRMILESSRSPFNVPFDDATDGLIKIIELLSGIKSNSDDQRSTNDTIKYQEKE